MAKALKPTALVGIDPEPCEREKIKILIGLLRDSTPQTDLDLLNVGA